MTSGGVGRYAVREKQREWEVPGWLQPEEDWWKREMKQRKPGVS